MKKTDTILTKVMQKRTRAWENKYYGDTHKCSRKEQKLADIVAGFGSYERLMTQLIEEITPYKIPKSRGAAELWLLGVVVPTRRPNGHNYSLGQPVTLKSGYRDVCYRADGTIGNSISHETGALRSATNAEIVDFVKKLPNRVKEELSAFVVEA